MPTPCDTTPEGQSAVSPAVTTTVDGEAVVAKPRSVGLTAGVAATIEWQFANPAGRPLDLTDLVAGDEHVTALYVAEATGAAPCPPVRLEGAFAVPAAGRVDYAVPADALRPGIYRGMAVIAAAVDGAVLVNNSFVINVARSPLDMSPGGPPDAAEIRVWLADSSRFENRLLDTLRYDDAEIALAASAAVDTWNETAPFIDPHTTRSFPFRAAWRDYIVGKLLVLEATRRRNNHLPSGAAGVQTDDQADAESFQQAGALLLQRFDTFCRQKKVSINVERCYGALGSGYAYGRMLGYGRSS